jgi:antitoxin component HigA of HigAB toxin-antitoxin module
METRHLRQSDLAALIGSRSRTSEILLRIPTKAATYSNLIAATIPI